MGGGKSKFVLYLFFCSRRYFFGALEMVWSVIRTEVITNIQHKLKNKQQQQQQQQQHYNEQMERRISR